uniref:t-SNARE coiled-coil homology domain-containing protein n=1 Tax=Pseudictyota dubia TaxID=2749911 RepID=A0A7R9WLG1_9STRA|eukprot:CAMPEP_0197449954 /NCGR_PEP_ID=MMETSP1175-20131217/23484_1 /TAXON_ID=1003142 /ORGANISM="Triceratium dubium, Strain CCMP147" /LENGTH=310 /DNA_ID=CAMNT_0042982247 /DNA_START=106 /DNA_END=1038 /DNA_ORIENTATION=+
MNDRLGDLGGGDTPDWAFDDDGSGKQQSGDDFGQEPEAGPAQPKHMETFFRDVESIKADIEAVSKATKRIGEINEDAVLATTDAKEAQLSNELRPLVDATNKRAKRTKNLLALLKEDNEKLKKEGDVKQSDMRIRENLCNTLTRKFIDEMKLYQLAQQKYKTDIKNKVKRQVQIVKPDATDEEIDMVMKSEGGREALYKGAILAGGVADSIKTAYSKAAGKYQDVLTLEQSVAELHQMFLDFALLTEQQGELLDHIEHQVKSAADYIEDANVEVHEAIEYSKKIRKKQCFIILIVIVLLIIVLFATGILP